MVGAFHARLHEFDLVSFGEISAGTIFKTLLLQRFSSNFNQTLYKVL